MPVMHDYELTDRGKILIAIVVAVIFLLVPAGILVFSALAEQPLDESGPGVSGAPTASVDEAAPSQPLITPPPSGGDFNPPGVQPPDVVASPSDPGGSEEPADTGLVIGGDPSGGTLSLTFSPGIQETLDSEALASIDLFLSNPGNSDKNRIVVELPRVPGHEEDAAMTAIVSALVERGVSEQRLAFIVSSDRMEEEGGVFVVRMYFAPYQAK